MTRNGRSRRQPCRSSCHRGSSRSWACNSIRRRTNHSGNSIQWDKAPCTPRNHHNRRLNCCRSTGRQGACRCFWRSSTHPRTDDWRRTSPKNKHRYRRLCRRNHRQDPRRSIVHPLDDRQAACTRWRECIGRCCKSRPRCSQRSRRCRHSHHPPCRNISPRRFHRRWGRIPSHPCTNDYCTPSLTDKDRCTSRLPRSRRQDRRRNTGRPPDCTSAPCTRRWEHTGVRYRFRPRCRYHSRDYRRSRYRRCHSISLRPSRKRPERKSNRPHKDGFDRSSPPDRLRCR
jgi:hypothetical protein